MELIATFSLFLEICFVHMSDLFQWLNLSFLSSDILLFSLNLLYQILYPPIVHVLSRHLLIDLLKTQNVLLQLFNFATHSCFEFFQFPDIGYSEIVLIFHHCITSLQSLVFFLNFVIFLRLSIFSRSRRFFGFDLILQLKECSIWFSVVLVQPLTLFFQFFDFLSEFGAVGTLSLDRRTFLEAIQWHHLLDTLPLLFKLLLQIDNLLHKLVYFDLTAGHYYYYESWSIEISNRSQTRSR